MVSIDQSRARSRIGTLDHPGIFLQIQGITANFNVRSFSRRRRRRRGEKGLLAPKISLSPDRVDAKNSKSGLSRHEKLSKTAV